MPATCCTAPECQMQPLHRIGLSEWSTPEQPATTCVPLQRVMDEYAGAARPGSKGGRSMDSSIDGHSDLAPSTASMWDSPEHVQLTINLLSSTLAGKPHGPAALLPLRGPARLVKCMPCCMAVVALLLVQLCVCACMGAAHGMPSELALQSERTGLDAASACRVLHALLRQRQRDVQRARDASERLARCASLCLAAMPAWYHVFHMRLARCTDFASLGA